MAMIEPRGRIVLVLLSGGVGSHIRNRRRRSPARIPSVIIHISPTRSPVFTGRMLALLSEFTTTTL